MSVQAPAFWPEACARLAGADAVLAAVIAQHGGHMEPRADEPLSSLLRAIVGQQISVKAAQSVWGRCQEAVGQTNTPQAWLALTPEALRACGLSAQKVRYVQGVAQAFAEGYVHPHLWPQWPDDAVQAELVALPGVGVWSAQMFLMFHLGRPDVLPVGDLGLQNGFKKLYGHLWKTPTNTKGWQGRMARHAAKHWAPYCTVATWYVWRSL